MTFNIIGRNIANASWNGSGTALNWHQGVTMPQTPNGTMILAYWNLAKENNDGTLSLTSGASAPQSLDVPAMPLMPSILVQNFQGNNLNLTNISASKATPIQVAAFGPGIPGLVPRPLPVDGSTIQLSFLQAAQGKAPPNYAQLVFINNTGNLCIMAVIGGPTQSGSNAYLFALNYPDPLKPPGFTSVTAGNTLTWQFNWTTSVYVANMSSSVSSSVAVSLISI